MAGALLFLTVRSARNAVASWARRLRQPRYAVGLGAGLLYFYWFFMHRPPTRSGRPAFGARAVLTANHDVVVVVGAAVLLAIAALAWLLPGSSRGVLKFLPAEVHFLFTAPIPRRKLNHYKVLRSCVRPVVSATFLTVLLRPATPAALLVSFAGILVIVETMNLYLVGVALRRQPGAAANVWTPRLIAGGALTLVVATVGLDWAALASAASGGEVAAELVRLGTTGAAGAVLLPLRALAGLPLAATPMAFLVAVPPGLLLLALTYRWASTADISAEGAAVTEPADSGGRAIADETAAKAPPFQLAPAGRAETALLWKNSIATSRVLSARLLLRVLPVVIALGAGVSAAARDTRGGRALGLIGMLCVALTGYAVLFGPQVTRNDLRRDLAHLATLKAWPLRGAVIVRGEVLAPTLLLSCLAWLFIGGALALSSNLRFAAGAGWPDRVSFAIAAALLAPGLILTQIVLHNAIALMFPAWIQAPNSRGVDVAGQRLVMMAGLMLALALACVLPAIAAGLVGLAIRQALGVLPVVVPAAVALVVLTIECGIATEALGGLFERTDIGAIQP